MNVINSFEYNSINNKNEIDNNEAKSKVLYPEAPCKHLYFDITGVLLVIAFMLIFSIGPTVTIMKQAADPAESDPEFLYLTLIPVYIFVIMLGYFLYRMVKDEIALNIHGKTITGLIYDYEIKEESFALIKIPSDEGDKTIFYRLYKNKKPCDINTEVELLVYKDFYKIKKYKVK